MADGDAAAARGQRTWPWLLLWVFLGAVVWNGVFDILVTRGVKEYLYREADHELGRGPAVTMQAIMRETVGDAAITASLWALAIVAAGTATIYRHQISFRLSRGT